MTKHCSDWLLESFVSVHWAVWTLGVFKSTSCILDVIEKYEVCNQLRVSSWKFETNRGTLKEKELWLKNMKSLKVHQFRCFESNLLCYMLEVRTTLLCFTCEKLLNQEKKKTWFCFSYTWVHVKLICSVLLAACLGMMCWWICLGIFSNENVGRYFLLCTRSWRLHARLTL